MLAGFVKLMKLMGGGWETYIHGKSLHLLSLASTKTNWLWQLDKTQGNLFVYVNPLGTEINYLSLHS